MMSLGLLFLNFNAFWWTLSSLTDYKSTKRIANRKKGIHDYWKSGVIRIRLKVGFGMSNILSFKLLKKRKGKRKDEQSYKSTWSAVKRLISSGRWVRVSYVWLEKGCDRKSWSEPNWDIVAETARYSKIPPGTVAEKGKGIDVDNHDLLHLQTELELWTARRMEKAVVLTRQSIKQRCAGWTLTSFMWVQDGMAYLSTPVLRVRKLQIQMMISMIGWIFVT